MYIHIYILNYFKRFKLEINEIELNQSRNNNKLIMR